MVGLADEMELQWKVFLTFGADKVKLNLYMPGKLLSDRYYGSTLLNFMGDGSRVFNFRGKYERICYNLHFRTALNFPKLFWTYSFIL